eukprot:500067-Prorocentrum_minimum.AAC.2
METRALHLASPAPPHTSPHSGTAAAALSFPEEELPAPVGGWTSRMHRASIAALGSTLGHSLGPRSGHDVAIALGGRLALLRALGG